MKLSFYHEPSDLTPEEKLNAIREAYPRRGTPTPLHTRLPNTLFAGYAGLSPNPALEGYSTGFALVCIHDFSSCNDLLSFNELVSAVNGRVRRDRENLYENYPDLRQLWGPQHHKIMGVAMKRHHISADELLSVMGQMTPGQRRTFTAQCDARASDIIRLLDGVAPCKDQPVRLAISGVQGDAFARTYAMADEAIEAAKRICREGIAHPEDNQLRKIPDLRI